MSFQLCGEQVDFCFALPTPSSLPSVHPVPIAHILFGPPAAVFET